MHFLSYVVLSQHISRVDTEVERILYLHTETETDNSDGLLDWYQIGGRWTGFFDGYDPTKDLANIETCNLCNGTGRRDDEMGKQLRRENPEYTCNGCSGKGDRTKWPTVWKRHDGDVIPLDNLPRDDKYVPHTLFVDHMTTVHKGWYNDAPDFPGWPHDKKISKAESNKRKIKIDEIETRIDTEHKTAFWTIIDQLKGKNFYLVIIDYHT